MIKSAGPVAPRIEADSFPGATPSVAAAAVAPINFLRVKDFIVLTFYYSLEWPV